MTNAQEQITKSKHWVGVLLIVATIALAATIPLLPLHSNTVVDLPFLDSEDKNKVLMFAGYPACPSVCPMQLRMLEQVYTRYSEQTGQDDLGVVFMNIDQSTSQELATQYASGFHKDFVAYSIKAEETAYLYKKLSLEVFANSEAAVVHRDSVYLFAADDTGWTLTRVFQNTTDSKPILDHLIESTI